MTVANSNYDRIALALHTNESIPPTVLGFYGKLQAVDVEPSVATTASAQRSDVSDNARVLRKKSLRLELVFSKYIKSNVCLVGSAEGTGKGKAKQSAYMCNASRGAVFVTSCGPIDIGDGDMAAARNGPPIHPPPVGQHNLLSASGAHHTSSCPPTVPTPHSAACIGSNW
jgi:hypothetical protein